MPKKVSRLESLPIDSRTNSGKNLKFFFHVRFLVPKIPTTLFYINIGIFAKTLHHATYFCLLQVKAVFNYMFNTALNTKLTPL